MKKIYMALCLVTICCNPDLLAQYSKPPVNEPDYNRPELFSSLPAKVIIPAGEINSLFTAERGNKVSLGLTTDTRNRLEGEIISITSKYGDSIRSISIVASNFKGARLTISRLITREGTITYMGRMISFAHADVYEMDYSGQQFLFIKKNWYDLVNE
ncbi:MAG: hypothetical protein ABIT05_06275 [Chitinophagaceae bacterium]